MKNLMKKIFAPLAVFALAIGVSISENNQSSVVGAKAEEVLYYSTSFDSTDGFTTSSTYNEPIKNQGNSPYLWDFLNGTVSTTSAVTSPSAHLRGYAGAQTPRLETVFAVPNITKVVFAYKSDTNISVDLSYSTDDRATWSTSTNFARASSNTTVTYLINSAGLPGNANIRWQMNNSGTSTGKSAELAIDDVFIYYNVGPVVNPTGVSIDGDSSISVVEGSTYQLTATVSPEDATNKTVIWTSSDESKATVDSYGLVTAISEGTAIVTATTEDGAFTAQCEITVNALILNSISIKTPADKTTFKLGEVFSWDGLIINANYNSGIVQKNTGFIVTGIDTTVLGEQEAIVSFEGKSITYTVWVVEEPLVLESSAFGGEESDWIVNGSFVTYFGHKYGIKSSLSIKNNSSFNALKARPVGTEISVEVIAASIESPGNKITVYGLNHEGNRITGIESSQLMRFGNYSGDLSKARNDAFANPTQIVLPVSFTDKVESIEISFSSSPNALLFEVNVSAYIANVEDQVSAFTGLVNDGLGNFANGKCEEVYNYLIDEFNLLDEEAQQEFEVSNETNILSARERINYLQAWVNTNSSLGLTRFHEGSTTENQVFAVITIGVLALSALIGYYFINKKKQYN